MKTNPKEQLLGCIKTRVWIVIIGLFLSGITAFPIETELRWLIHFTSNSYGMNVWLNNVYRAVASTNSQYQYLSYGTDWLAFAHIMLAILFTGILRDPVRNIWVVEFGIIASVAVFPLAFIAGNIRHIPIFWRLLDCSFGVVTLITLLPCYRMIKRLNTLKNLYL